MKSYKLYQLGLENNKRLQSARIETIEKQIKIINEEAQQNV